MFQRDFSLQINTDFCIQTKLYNLQSSAPVRRNNEIELPFTKIYVPFNIVLIWIMLAGHSLLSKPLTVFVSRLAWILSWRGVVAGWRLLLSLSDY